MKLQETDKLENVLFIYVATELLIEKINWLWRIGDNFIWYFFLFLLFYPPCRFKVRSVPPLTTNDADDRRKQWPVCALTSLILGKLQWDWIFLKRNECFLIGLCIFLHYNLPFFLLLKCADNFRYRIRNFYYQNRLYSSWTSSKIILHNSLQRQVRYTQKMKATYATTSIEWTTTCCNLQTPYPY